jgi:hypothetical protein
MRARKLEIGRANGEQDAMLQAFSRELAGLPRRGCTALHLHTAVPEFVEAAAAVAREKKLAVSYAWDVDQWRREGILFLYNARTPAASGPT